MCRWYFSENEELKAEIAERDRQLQEFAEKYSALESKIRQYDIEQYQNQIDVLMEQQENLLTRNSQLEQSLLLKSSDTESVAIDTYESVKQTPKLDRGTQTEEQGQDKLSQVNSKLKRALQSLKEKIHRVVVEHPDLFLDTTDDTLERLDHLAVSLRNQSSHTAALQNERDLLRDEIDRLQRYVLTQYRWILRPSLFSVVFCNPIEIMSRVNFLTANMSRCPTLLSTNSTRN